MTTLKLNVSLWVRLGICVAVGIIAAGTIPASPQTQSEQPKALPRLNSNDKVRDGGAGNACPPQGCRN